jgi:hypothetical protein
VRVGVGVRVGETVSVGVATGVKVGTTTTVVGVGRVVGGVMSMQAAVKTLAASTNPNADRPRIDKAPSRTDRPVEQADATASLSGRAPILAKPACADKEIVDGAAQIQRAGA